MYVHKYKSHFFPPNLPSVSLICRPPVTNIRGKRKSCCLLNIAFLLVKEEVVYVVVKVWRDGVEYVVLDFFFLKERASAEGAEEEENLKQAPRASMEPTEGLSITSLGS